MEIKKRPYYYSAPSVPIPQQFIVYGEDKRATVEDPQTKLRGEIVLNPYGWFDWEMGKHEGKIHGFENALNDVCCHLLLMRPNDEWKRAVTPKEQIVKFFEGGGEFCTFN